MSIEDSLSASISFFDLSRHLVHNRNPASTSNRGPIMSMSILTAVTTAANVVFDADASVLGCGCTHKPPVPHLPNLLPATETDRTSSANVTSCASREALSQNLSVQEAAAAPIAEPCCVEAPQPRASDVAGSLFQSSAAAATSPYHRRQHRAAVAFVRDCLWQALQACLELCWIALVIVVFVIGCSLSRRIESMRASCNRAGLQVALSEVSRGEVEFAAHPAVQYAEPPAVILGPRSPNKLEGDSPTSLDCSLGPSYALDLILPHIWSQSALRSHSICDHIHGNCSSIRAPGVLDYKRNTRRENSLPMVRAASAVRGFLQTDCDSRIQRNQCKEGDADASSLYEGMNGLSHTLETEVLHYQQEATSVSATRHPLMIAEEGTRTEDPKTGGEGLEWNKDVGKGLQAEEERGSRNVPYLGLLMSSSSNESHPREEEFVRTARKGPEEVQQGDGMLSDKQAGGAGKHESLHEGWAVLGEPQPLKAVSI